MKKRYQHIDLPPELQEFRKNFLAATEVEGTLCGIITCYRMYGLYFIRSKSSLTGKRVKTDKRFRQTMHNAGVLAMASAYVTPIYNSLTEDWRCQELQRKLVGQGVKLLHQGYTKEAVQEAVWKELLQLGYRTEWPVWQLPPELAKWVKEEQSGVERTESGVLSAEEGVTGCVTSYVVPEKSGWVVNEKGELLFEGCTSHVSHLPNVDITTTVSRSMCRENEVARAP